MHSDSSASPPASPALRGATRYQARSILSEERGVITYRGVDPVTGLPVLIYRFQGAPRAGVDRLDAQLMPRVLAHRHSGDEGIVITVLSSACVPARAPLTMQQLKDSAAALQAAATLGLVHGALTAERFLLAGDNLLLAGYGVPWQDPDGEPASLAGDVSDWAETIRMLGHPTDDRIESLLERATAPTPEDRPEPAGLVRELADIRGGSPTRQPKAPAEAQQPATAAASVQAGPPPGLAADPPVAPANALPGAPAEDPLEADRHEFVPRAMFATEQLSARSLTDEPSELGSSVRDLPIGATYRTAEVLPATRVNTAPQAEEPLSPPPRRFRTLMIVALLVMSALLAGLLLFWRGSVTFRQPPPVAGTPAVAYIIDVQVEPHDLPPVSLYVLEAPPGSAFRSGGEVGTAPRKIALDASGTWVFEGRFQDRRSGPVTVQVPEDRNRAVIIPVPPAGR